MSSEEKLKWRVKRLESALKDIRDYKPTEITYDEFAYKRLVRAYRDAARFGLRARPRQE